jgi:hypothetical protein
MPRRGDIPRWEEVKPDEIDYLANDGVATGYERDLGAVRHQIETTEAQVRSLLSQLGISPGSNPVDVSIPQHRQFTDPYSFHLVRRVRTAQRNLENRRRRFCELYALHRAKKQRLREEVKKASEKDDEADTG